jgi:predicted RND superfamily exporter protein
VSRGAVIDFLPFALGSGLALAAGLASAARRPHWIIEHPVVVLVLLGLVTLGAGAAIVRLDPPGLRIELDPSSEPLLPSRDPGQQVYRESVLDFGSDDIYVVAMQTENLFTAQNLEALRRVTDAIRQLPGVRGAESLTDVYAFRWDAQEQWVEVGKFIDDVPDSAAELGRLREEALSDPLYPKALVSHDGRTAAVNVTFETMTDREFVERDLDGRITSILAAEATDGRRFYVSGRPHIRSEAHHLMIHDLVLLIPIAVAVAAALMWFMTGSLRGTLIPLGACLTGTIWAFGAMALLGVDLNIITLVLGPMLICVGSVYGIHVLARHEAIALETYDREEAARRTLEYTRLPVLIAGLSTCMGFGALLLSDVRATHELGIFSVFGVASTMLLSLTGIPAALALVPLEACAASDKPLYEARTRASARIGRGLDAALGVVGSLGARFPGAALAGWALLALLAAALIPSIVIDTDYLTVFDPDTRVRRDFARVNELLAGAVPIYVVFQGEREGAFREPALLRTLEAIQSDLERVDGVSQVLSAVDLVRIANRAIEEGRPEAERIPATRPAVAEAIFTIPKEKLRRFATSNHSSANLVVRTGSLGSAAVRDLESRIREVLARNPLPPGLRADVTGNAILINRSADGIAGNQIAQVSFAAATILLLVWSAFRSLRMALLSMVPNVVPVLIFFGALGAGAATLSVATSLIGCIALGIAVDDTVHFLVAYNRDRWAGRSPEAAAVHCVRSVGRPIALTSVMLIVGFMTLFVSGFATLREFGYLTAMTMAICLSTDLGLLPALLTRARI